MLEPIYRNSDEILEALREYGLQEELEDLIVAIYGVTGKAFDKEAYQGMVEHLKESCDYSIMNMNNACIFAALLLIRYEYPFSKVSKLKQVIDQVRSAGYYSRVSNYMAYVLLEEEDVDDRLSKAAEIYQFMQEIHGLITGEDDFLASIYLSYLSESPKEIIDATEQMYNDLASLGFRKGNALQNLSHQITIMGDGERDSLLQHVANVHDMCNRQKIKLNGSQYVLYGLIAFVVMDYPSFMSELLTTIDSYKALLDTRRLRTIQANVVIIDCLRKYLEENDVKLEVLSEWQQKGILATLLMLLVNYLFRERLL